MTAETIPRRKHIKFRAEANAYTIGATWNHVEVVTRPPCEEGLILARAYYGKTRTVRSYRRVPPKGGILTNLRGQPVE